MQQQQQEQQLNILRNQIKKKRKAKTNQVSKKQKIQIRKLKSISNIVYFRFQKQTKC